MASQDSPVVSVRIVRPPVPEPEQEQGRLANANNATSGATPARATPAPALTWPQQPCIVSGASSAIGAGVLGFFFGAIPSMLRNRRLGAWQIWAADGWRSTLGLGLVSGVYTWVHCLAMRIRLRDDGWNRGVAGCATGLLLGWQGGPVSAAQSCVGLGALSWILDFAGAGDTPPANAADLYEIHHHTCTTPSHALQHIQAEYASASKPSCLSTCTTSRRPSPDCSDMQLHPGTPTTCSPEGCCCGTSPPTELAMAMVALARAACALAGSPVPSATEGSTGPGRPDSHPACRQLRLQQQAAADLLMSPAAVAATASTTCVGRKLQAGGGLAPQFNGTGASGSAIATITRAALPAPNGSTKPDTSSSGGATCSRARGGSTAPLASVMCSACSTGHSRPGQRTNRQNHHRQYKDDMAALLAVGAGLLAWPQPLAPDARLPPVMWLGQVMAQPYFQQMSW